MSSIPTSFTQSKTLASKSHQSSNVSSAPMKDYQPHKKVSSRKQKDVNVAQMTLPVTRAPPKEKVVIKKILDGVFESNECNFCGPTNHFCRAPLPGTMIFLEGRKFCKICGKLACMNCSSKLGDAEDFLDKCMYCTIMRRGE